ncbi:hypothetical protein K9M79_04070 [Candidatus Woesearchaeota archaeon]|nr:hypothetical protein [Candidatus Woesearchaeota archaeon]
MKRLILLLVPLILVFGCTDGSSSTTLGSKDRPFLGGTSGLSIDFEEDAPPPEVFDQGQYAFDVSVKLENHGESEIAQSDCKVTLSGVAPDDFGKSSGDFEKNPDKDIGNKYKDAEGNIIEDDTLAYSTFDGLNFQGTLEGNKVFPIRIDVCYKYETRAMADICLRKNLLDLQEEGACKVNEQKVVYNSGAPIQVTDFKEVPGGANSVRFTFRIQHVGTGDFFEPESWCDSTGVTYEDKVKVTVDTGMSGLSCNGLSGGTSGIVNVRGGERSISCEQTSSVTTDQVKTVNINVEYDYEEDKSIDLLVKHPIS